MVPVESGQAAGEGGLATARAADDGEAFAGVQVEVRGAQDGGGASAGAAVVPGDEVAYAQDGGTDQVGGVLGGLGTGRAVGYRPGGGGADVVLRHVSAALAGESCAVFGEETAGPCVARCVPQALGGARLDDAARVQDEDLVGEGADHVQVVAEQDDRDAAGRDRRQLVDDAALGERVLAGGGFVRDDDAGAEEEGLGEDDALLLAAGELVGPATQQGVRVGELSRCQGFEHPFPGRRAALRAGQVTYLGAGDVVEQGADAAGRVEDGGGMLRHVPDRAVPGPAHLPGDPGSGRILPQQREAGGGLAAPGGTDQGGHPAGVHTQVHAVDDGPAGDLDAQVTDLGDQVGLMAHGRRPFLSSAASKSRLVPVVRATISRAGTTTAQGWMNRPVRLRSTITAQSAASGATPTPRNAAVDTRYSTPVSRIPASAARVRRAERPT